MKTKTCFKCKEEKLISEFSKNKNSDDGLNFYCKKCRLYLKKEYRRTKNGVVSAIYEVQKINSKKRKHFMPSYSKDELKEWLFNHPNFHELYDNWVNSGYDKYMKPSVDRINDYKSYTMDNIQLMTWKENQDKSFVDKINGINNKQSRAVLQFDLEGNFIAEYYSMSQASRETGISNGHICDVCNNKIMLAKGYRWIHKI